MWKRIEEEEERRRDKGKGRGGGKKDGEEEGSVSTSALLEQNFKFYALLTLGGNYVRTLLDPSVLDAHKF